MADPDLYPIDEFDGDEFDGDEFGSDGVPESRAYFHLACQSYTTVTGSDFYGLSNPLLPSPSTYCVECEDYVDLHQVYWAETKESIAHYRQRLLKEMPLGRRIFYRTVTLVIGAVLSFAVAVFFFDWFAALLIAGPVDALLNPMCREHVLRRLCRVEFRDCL